MALSLANHAGINNNSILELQSISPAESSARLLDESNQASDSASGDTAPQVVVLHVGDTQSNMDFLKLLDGTPKSSAQSSTSSTQTDPILSDKGRYIINGTIVLSTSVLQTIVFRILDDTNGNSTSEKNGAALFADMSLSRFSNKMLRGNFREVDSCSKQLLVLLAHIASSTALDATISFIPIKGASGRTFGQTSTIAVLNAFGYVCQMSAAKILGKKPYLLGDGAEDDELEPANMAARKAANCGLVIIIGMGLAAVNRAVDSNTALSVVLNTAGHEFTNKLYRAGQKVEKETANRVKVLMACWTLSVASDVLMGLMVPRFDGLHRSWSDPLRYFSLATLASTVATIKLLIRARRGSDDDDKSVKTETSKNGKGKGRRSKKNRSVSLWKKIGSAVGAVATPVLTIIANQVNALTSRSSTASLGIKMVQHSTNQMFMRDLFKRATTTLQQAAVIVCPLAAALCAELLAQTIFPGLPGAGDFPVTAVATGMAAGFTAQAISNRLLKREEDDDE